MSSRMLRVAVVGLVVGIADVLGDPKAKYQVSWMIASR